jgi:steroid 5-alpha reductase family enzyme
LFNLHYATWARLSGLETERVNTIFVFSLIWSARLTFNYWRKGGYEVGSEDYRWELIKKYIGSFAFLLLNVLFISTVQLVCTAAVAKCKDASDFC